MDEKKGCTVVNHYYGCCGGNGTSNDSTPVGTVISYMGTNAPEHYLACDGTIYNIADYEYFSQFIKDQFGSYNYFGGDGTTTFAVPDLRGEFLRGTGTATRDTGTGADVGVHQSATTFPNVGNYNNGNVSQIIQYYPNAEINFSTGADKLTNNSKARVIVSGTIDSTAVDVISAYTSKPTNTAVLYCIKYE